MRITEVQREILRTVVRRFVADGEPTPRIQVAKTVKDPDVVDPLSPIVLRNEYGKKLFPTILAFECSGDTDSLQIGRRSLEIVVTVLKDLFESETDPEKVQFTIAEIEDRAQSLFPDIDAHALKLGLYLVQDLSGTVHAGIDGIWPNQTFVRVIDRIVMIQDIPGLWKQHVEKYRLFLNGGAGNSPQPSPLTEPRSASAVPPQPDVQWDFFISHASEDKLAIARPLADMLVAKGMTVWYDDFSLKVGDSLQRSIDRGLLQSRFGIVILSHHFFAKHWPQKELNGLANLEFEGRKVILPVWHGIGAKDMRSYSPMLADRIAVSTDNPLEHVVEKLLIAAGLQVKPPPVLKAPKGRIAVRETVRQRKGECYGVQKVSRPHCCSIHYSLRGSEP